MESKALALQEHMQLGDVFYKSGLFADLKSAAQAIVKIQAGAELGIPPFAAMSGISIIQGKPALGASLIAGLIKSSHKYDYRVVKHDATGCVIEFYEGETKLGESSFTTDDAKRAGLLGRDIWTKYPRNMLFSRAMSNGARWYTPDLFTGPIYTPEELDGTALEADYRVVEEPKAEAPAPEPEPTTEQENGKPAHWITVPKTRAAFWARATELGLTNVEVHKALGVEHVEDFGGTIQDAGVAIRAYIAQQEKGQVEQMAAELGGVVA